jgi:phage shock protein A
MAEMQSATRTPGTQGSQASTRQDSHDTAERYDHMQETAKEMRDKAQELVTQGKEVAAEYYEEGRNQVLAWQQQLENQVREKPLLLYGLLRRR